MSIQLNNSPSSGDLLKVKKQRINFSKMSSYSATPPTSVARRNERERNRVKMVNMGFATLRQHVPNGVKNKKMSKVETLRSAVEYIRQLQKLLGQTNENSYDQFSSLTDFNLLEHDDENCYSSQLSMLPSPVESTSSMEQHQINYPVPGNFNSNHSGSLYSISSSPDKVYDMPQQSQQQQPMPQAAQSRTSPSPSSIASDLTGSSSPYDTSSMMNQQHLITMAIKQEDNELFDFNNWF